VNPGRPEATKRIDPSGKAALFSAPPAAAPDQLAPGREKAGKEALYSTGGPQPGTVVVDCHRCRVRTRATFAELGLSLLPFNLWWPGKHYAHLMRCPACKRRTWCRIGWNE
jgi:hypothetical protein